MASSWRAFATVTKRSSTPPSSRRVNGRDMPSRVTTTCDRVLDDDSIDAVTFATPNHWHSLSVIWGCQAGKDVYVEKPGSHNIFEGRKMVEAARKYDRIVQHGTQCRSSANIIEGIGKLHEGIIGDVYFARGIAYKIRGDLGQHAPRPVPQGLDWDAWCGPAPVHEFSNFQHRRWHWIWDYGNGEIGNQGVHQMDILRWGLKLDTHPSTRVVGWHQLHAGKGSRQQRRNARPAVDLDEMGQRSDARIRGS